MKKTLVLVLFAILAVSLLCPSALAQSHEVTEPVSIEFWHALSNADLLNALIDEFEEQNPLITVDPIYQGDWTDINAKLSAAIAGGDGSQLPAVITLNPSYLGTFADGGMIASLEEHIADDQFALDEFSTGLVNTFTWNGVTYGLPYLNSCLVMYYNTEMAEAEGLEIPELWTDMNAFMEKATTEEHKAMGMHAGGVWYFQPFFTNRAAVFGTDEAPTAELDNPLCVEIATDLQRWYQEGKMDYFYGSSAGADGRAAFAEGKLFCYVQSSAIHTNLQAMCDFEVAMTWPVGGERGRYSYVGGQGIGLVAGVSEAQRDAGWQLIQYLTSPEVNIALAEETGYLPTRTTILETEAGQAYVASRPAYLPVIEMLDNVECQPRYNNAVTTNDIWRAEMSRAIIEGGDMQAVMESIAEQMQEIIADN